MAQTLHERFELFSAEYRSFLTSDALRALLIGYATNLELAELEIDVFQNTIMLFLLGFIDQKELVVALQTECGLTPTESPVVVNSFLNILPEQVIADLQLFKYEINTPALNDDITETEAVLQQINVVRTMARDMHDLESQAPQEPNSHQSTQATTLNPDPMNPPSAPPTPQPRWDSTT